MYAGKVSGFVRPVKNALAALLGHIPNARAFAGAEDLAGENAEGNSEFIENSSGKLSLKARLKNFKNSLKEMSDFQKLILLTIAVCLPAGFLVATILVGFFKKR